MLTARGQSGFTYLTILFVIAFLGVGQALVGEAWHTAAMREREAELLYVGNQYRKAIERYYRSGQARYPRELADLLKDPRKPGVERYLRRAYPDPVTGKDEWGIVKAPDGGVMGVYSLSEGKPLKNANFRVQDRDFEKGVKYADWKFVYLPLTPSVPLQGAKPAPGTPGAPGAPGTPPFPQGAPGTSPFPQGTPGTSPFPQGAPGTSPFPQGAPGMPPFPQGAPTAPSAGVPPMVPFVAPQQATPPALAAPPGPTQER